MITSLHSDILQGIQDVINIVVPSSVTWEAPVPISGPIIHPEMGVLIGITGDVPSRLVIAADMATFSALAVLMYGMELEGDILESFVGEFGNIVGGNLCTRLSLRGLRLEITPPTVFVGPTKLTGFREGLSTAFSLLQSKTIRVILMQDQHGGSAVADVRGREGHC